MNEKRLLSILLVISIITLLFPAQSFAETLALGSVKDRISAGYDHAAVVKDDGTVWTWGNNNYGQLGDGTTTNRSTPVQVKGINNMVAVKAGMYNTLALKSDGTVWAWGQNIIGELGDGTTTNRSAPVQVKGINNVIMIHTDYGRSTAVKKDGTLWGWGSYAAWRESSFYNTLPLQYMNYYLELKDYVDFTNSWWDTTTVGKDGAVCVGRAVDNFEETCDILTEHETLTGFENIISVDSGGNFTVALTEDGYVWGWEYHNFPDKYDIDHYYAWTPKKDPDISEAIDVAAGNDGRTVFVKKDGTVWDCCHIYSFEEPPEQIKGLTDIVAVDSGYDYTIALKKNGSVWEFRHNSNDMLIDGIATSPNYISITDKTLINLISNSNVQKSTIQAIATNSKIVINGKNVTFEAYNINNNNYFKLRDLAEALNGSKKQFEITWDGKKNAINILTNHSYTSEGGELSVSNNVDDINVLLSNSKIYLDGDIKTLTIYNINGNNYFKLRDVGKLINFSVTWDGVNNTINIDTSKNYISE